MISVVLGLIVVAGLLVWMLGGFVLRLVGGTLFWLGLFNAIVLRTPVALIAAAIGGLLWALGQMHYKLRWLDYKTPLAYRVLSFFEQVTGRRSRS